jgi:hypothetical protein
MSEHYTPKHEKSAETSHDSHELQERQKELLNEAKREAGEARNHHQEKLEDIRHEIEQNASQTNEMSVGEQTDSEGPASTNTYWNSREYRDVAYKQLLNKARKHLNKQEKMASKIFHQPVIERASEIGSKTVARPSGVLVGSIVSFIASAITYVLSKRYGYDMSYAVFMMSFIGGFAIGVLGEFSVRSIRLVLARN